MQKRLPNHGLTKDQIKDLKVKQQEGEDIKTVPCNKYPKHEIPEHEQHLVHAWVAAKGFNSDTGERLDKGAVQSYYVDNFVRMQKEGAFDGKDVEVYHDPRIESKGGKPDNNNGNPLTLKIEDFRKEIVTKTAEEVADLLETENDKKKPRKGFVDAMESEIKSKRVAQIETMDDEALVLEYKTALGDDANEDATPEEIRAFLLSELD